MSEKKGEKKRKTPAGPVTPAVTTHRKKTPAGPVTPATAGPVTPVVTTRRKAVNVGDTVKCSKCCKDAVYCKTDDKNKKGNAGRLYYSCEACDNYRWAPGSSGRKSTTPAVTGITESEVTPVSGTPSVRGITAHPRKHKPAFVMPAKASAASPNPLSFTRRELTPIVNTRIILGDEGVPPFCYHESNGVIFFDSTEEEGAISNSSPTCLNPFFCRTTTTSTTTGTT